MSWTNLENESLLIRFQGPNLVRAWFKSGTERLESEVFDRRRNIGEVFERASSINSLVRAAGETFIPARPYARLFNLTFAVLVVTDPLDRIR